MKKVYVVFKDNSGMFYAAHHARPKCPIFGSFSTRKSHATLACANRMCLTVSEYNSLSVV